MSYMRHDGEQMDPVELGGVTPLPAPDEWVWPDEDAQEQLATDFVAAMRVLAGITSPTQAERMRLLASMLTVADRAGLED